MKKLLVLVATAVGAAVVRNKIQQGQADNQLWAEATKASNQQDVAASLPYGGTSS